jgi:AICAR transformylase/IMP cyclohydrolase PurH
MQNKVKRVLPMGICCFAMLTAAYVSAAVQNSVAEYCEIALKIMNVTELQMKDRISLARSHSGSREELDAALQSLDAKYERAKAQVYSSYGTTLQAHLRYGASHQEAINLYLEENSDVKNMLEDTSQRIQSLRQEMDSLMSAKPAGDGRR